MGGLGNTEAHRTQLSRCGARLSCFRKQMRGAFQAFDPEPSFARMNEPYGVTQLIVIHDEQVERLGPLLHPETQLVPLDGGLEVALRLEPSTEHETTVCAAIVVPG